ncbi:MAG TPA: two-component regulator propeller domain-containing protein, partial [Saprospiraceae bacterium]|nr:two-component regulator propeller domain-containing protein [Saprospiraceae bacterium]
MLQDSLGRLWIGTDDGLDCFDGNKFIQITSYDGLYSNYVIGLCNIPGFKMGIATWGGGSQVLDLDELKVERCADQYLVKLKNIFYAQNLLISAPDYVLHKTDIQKSTCEPEHYTIVKAAGGRLQLKSFDNSGKLGHVEDYYRFSGAVMGDVFYVFNDPKKTVLKTTPLPGIYRLPRGKNLDLEQNPEFDFAKEQYVSLVTSYQDKVYVAVSDTLYLLKNKKIIEQKKLPLQGNAITKLAFITENRYVIITIDANGNKYGYFYDDGNLIDLKQYCNIRNSLSDILIDNDQNIWISSYGDGLFQLMLKKELISYMGTEQFLDPNIYGMTKSKSGSMILLARDYVYEYRGGQVLPQAIDNTCRELKSDNYGNYLFCFDAPQKSSENKYIFKPYENSLLENIGEVNNFHQFITLNKDTNKIYLQNGIQIKSLAKINADLFWIADLFAIYKISVSKKAVVETVPFDKVMCSNKITKLLNHENKLYIATDRCLMMYENGKWERIAFERPDEIISVNDMVIPENGDVWVASQQGLYRLNDSGVFKLGKSSGLLNDYVKSVCLDDNGKLWAATNNGVNIVDIQNLKTSTFPQFHIKQKDCSFNIFAISLEKPSSVVTQYQ